MDKSAWIQRVPGVLTVAVALAYALLTPSGLYWLDSSELSAAALRLGNPHPTGFSLYVLFSRVLSYLPLGELSFRVHLFSALSAGLMSRWLYLLVSELASDLRFTHRPAKVAFPQIAGIFVVGLSVTNSLMVLHGSTAEVYVPTLALAAGTLLALSRVVRGGGPKEGIILAVFLGIGFGVHSSFRLLFFLPALAVFGWRLYRGARWPLIAPIVTAAIACSTLIYHPLRSLGGGIAGLDWNHSDNWGRLFDYLSAGRIRRSFSEEIFSDSIPVLTHHLEVFATQQVNALGVVSLSLAALALLGAQRLRPIGWALVFAVYWVLADVAYSVLINPMGIADMQNGLPTAMGLAVLSALGVMVAAQLAGQYGHYVGAALASLALVVTASSSVMIPRPASAGESARDYAELRISEIEPRSRVFSSSDSVSANWMFMSFVEYQRPDLVPLVKQHLVNERRNREVLERAEQRLPDSREELIFGDNPSYWELGSEGVPNEKATRVHSTLIRIPFGDNSSEYSRAELQKLGHSLREVFSGNGDEMQARRALSSALTKIGSYAFRFGDFRYAETLYSLARKVDGQNREALVNLAVAFAKKSDFSAALVAAQAACEVDPISELALVAAARYAIRENKEELATNYLEAALVIDQRSASALALMGLVAARQGEIDSAIGLARQALRLDPRNRDAQDLARQLDRP